MAASGTAKDAKQHTLGRIHQFDSPGNKNQKKGCDSEATRRVNNKNTKEIIYHHIDSGSAEIAISASNLLKGVRY